ncbi:VOC family protein [Cellulomonas sp. URHB0016]
MEFRLELVFVPVSDVDRAKAFYADQVGFHVDHDQTVSEDLRFVQLTAPGSACSIAIGKGLIATRCPARSRVCRWWSTMRTRPGRSCWSTGSRRRRCRSSRGGRFSGFKDPDGNEWTIQQLPAWRGEG